MELRFENIIIPAASLGEDNCLPDIKNNKYLSASLYVTDRVTADERKYISKGMLDTILPYRMQDGYDRNRKDTEFPAAILENEYLKAVFLPSVGGRLWSLIDKKENRELLYCNSVFQPANLALRNAWFSGGVEWNVGIKGHNPLTCSPLFACKCTNVDGSPVLKLYEYERIRGVVYSIYATLKNDVLLIHPIIENTEDKEKYMYWWSNIAVDELPGMRILAPANDTFVSYYSENSYILDSSPMPMVHIKGADGPTDVTYPDQISRSADFFYKIPTERAKWIASIDQEGNGLAQFSDSLLQGRKLFVWGRQQGGRHWNEWLSDSYKPYVEIQAGLLKTQQEHFPMGGKTTISWTEGYCAVHGDASQLHSENYPYAADCLENIIHDKFSFLDPRHFQIIDQSAPILLGSGWGAVENLIRPVAISNFNDFPMESVTSEQSDWINLLQNNKLPDHRIDTPIASYVVGEFWETLLRKNITENWYDYYHLAVICAAACRYDEAVKLFTHSNELHRNPWALRSIAQIQKNIYGNTSAASDNMLKSVEMKNDYRPLLCDCAETLISDHQYKKWIDVFDSLPSHIKENGRLKFYKALCLIKLERLEEAQEILQVDFTVCDLKEGEYAISQLWIELYRMIIARDEKRHLCSISDSEVLEAYPLPYTLDFRMH